MYALIKEGVVSKYPYSVTDAKRDNPNVSFPPNPDDETMSSFGVMRVFFSAQPSVTDTQVLEEGLPVFDTAANRWTQVWSVRDMSAEELQQRTDSQAAQIRAQRNELLSQSDWTQLADTPTDKALWAAYRQELRDVTSQAGFPWDVQWPVAPA